MFTVKLSYSTHGSLTTDVIECNSVRVSHPRDGGAVVAVHGGQMDGLCAYVGLTPPEHCTHMHSVIVENASGKTTEIFRDHRDLDDWRMARQQPEVA